MSEPTDTVGEVSLVGGRSTVTRRGNILFRKAAPWSPTTISLLRHLEREGFDHAPRIIGSGFDAEGREMLTFIEGESPHPYPWTDGALPLVGAMLRRLHDATVTFVPPPEALWRPWFGRDMGQPTVIGHCDTGAWNIIARGGMPVALIDWEAAGPVDPLVELAQACWLNALLFDDNLAEKLGLGSAESRGRQVRMLLDGYELPSALRSGFVARIRDFVVLNAANELIEGRADAPDAPTLLEALEWRARSAGWMVRNHDALDRIVTAL